MQFALRLCMNPHLKFNSGIPMLTHLSIVEHFEDYKSMLFNTFVKNIY